MNEILTSLENLSSLQSSKLEDVGFLVFLIVMLTSAVSSYLASLFYLGFYGGKSTGSQIHRAFPLLGISITAIFLSIQFSLPLSLGLLGALSIVRFRTPIKEPEEIGFIMLVVALSISCAIFNFQFVLLLLVLSFLTLLYIKTIGYPVKPTSKNGLIIISLSQKPNDVTISDISTFVKGLSKTSELESVIEEAQGRMVITYRVSGGKELDIDSAINYVKGIDSSGMAEFYLNNS